MPTSLYHQINEIGDLINALKPQSVLDIGVGFGKWGFLCREMLEFADDRKEGGAENYCRWRLRIDGIEIYEAYITPMHHFLYDHLYIGNAIDLLPTLDHHYDLVNMIDVLEHFTYEEGCAVMRHCLERGRNVLVSTPRDIKEQGTYYENTYETHQFQWLPSHFRQFGDHCLVDHDYSYIAMIGQDVDVIRSRMCIAAAQRKIKRYRRNPILRAYHRARRSLHKYRARKIPGSA